MKRLCGLQLVIIVVGSLIIRVIPIIILYYSRCISPFPHSSIIMQQLFISSHVISLQNCGYMAVNAVLGQISKSAYRYDSGFSKLSAHWTLSSLVKLTTCLGWTKGILGSLSLIFVNVSLNFLKSRTKAAKLLGVHVVEFDASIC